MPQLPPRRRKFSRTSSKKQQNASPATSSSSSGPDVEQQSTTDNKTQQQSSSDMNSNNEQTSKSDQSEATENGKTDTTVESEQTHENFLKSAQEGMAKDSASGVTLEPVHDHMHDQITNPHVQPKIHRKEALDGISNGKTDDAEGGGSGHGDESVPPPPEEEETEFNPTPPGPDDAPKSEGDTKGPGSSPTPPETTPFQIPTGNADDLVDSAAKALNYLIDTYGDVVVGVKIHKDYYLVPRVIPLITEHNKQNNEDIKLKPAEIEMLKKPLVKLMQERGMRGLTPGEELAAAAVIILVGKIKVIVQIRKRNAMLESSFIYEVNLLRQQIAASMKTTAESSKTNGNGSAETETPAA